MRMSERNAYNHVMADQLKHAYLFHVEPNSGNEIGQYNFKIIYLGSGIHPSC